MPTLYEKKPKAMQESDKHHGRIISRCINLDWLEIYALEPLEESPHDADFFRRVGLTVREREYGTPVYKEMFTILGHDDLPLLEIRRNPKSAIGKQENGVLPPNATHIRLCNRTCYFEDAADLMANFLATYHYSFSRISRLDICLDFERFDYGDDPQKFLNRFVNGRYSKINQANISMHGLDCWDGRYWNSIKWGSHKSMVSTKFYDKTKELAEQSDKPYIRQAWWLAGLVDDWRTLEKKKPSGEVYRPKIWRVEFSIKSGVNNWFVVENPYNTKPKLRSIRHTLDRYKTKQQMCDVFFSLCHHYFHFKKVEYIDNGASGADRQLKRKDRCADKQLFDMSAIGTFYKVAAVNTNEKKSKLEDRLLRYLQQYQEQTIESKVHKAIHVLIEHIETMTHRNEIVGEVDEKTIQIIRLLVQRRLNKSEHSFEDDLNTVRWYIENEPDLW